MSSAFASPRPFAFPALLAAACLSALGLSGLPAQTVGTVDPVFSNGPALGYTIYTQLLETVDSTPVLFTAGDRVGLDFINLNDVSPFKGADTFTVIGGFGRIIYTAVPEVVPQADGSHNFFVAGQLGRTALQIRDGGTAKNILRINPRGTVDESFNPSKGSNGFITSVTPLANGDVLIAGTFDQFNGQPRERIVRVDNSGAIVPASAFDAGLSFDAPVLSVATQSVNGDQFVVAGQFLSVNGAKHLGLVRLNDDGTVDANFNPSFDDRTTVVVTQADGKILVGGDFSTVNGESHKHLVRLNYDGSVDNSFAVSVTGQPFGFINPPAVYVIKILDDGSMYLGGNFDTVNGVTRRFLARVAANGALDTSFDPGKAVINAVQSLTVLPDSLIVGETISQKVNDGTKFPPSLIRIYTEATNVTLTATRPTAGEASQSKGTLRLRRSSNVDTLTPTTTLPALTVTLQLTTNSQTPRDFRLTHVTALDAAQGLYTATLPAGQRTLNIGVRAQGHVFTRPPLTRQVTLTVVDSTTAGARYNAGGSATVTLDNN